jgi:excisionase family DNA binding protein
VIVLDLSEDLRAAAYLAAAIRRYPDWRRSKDLAPVPAEITATLELIAAAAENSAPSASDLASTSEHERTVTSTDRLSAEAGSYAGHMLTVDQASERLGVHESTVRRWVRKGELPAVRRGRTIRIDRADLENKERPCH